MGLQSKCCVSGCSSTIETHKLYCFPTNDILRNLWLSFLVPANSSLLGLTKYQLLKFRVCELHFDVTQFDQEGKRYRDSYPCLISEKEIEHGVPLLSNPGLLEEHNYSKTISEDEEGLETATARADDPEFCEHPYCSEVTNESIKISGPLESLHPKARLYDEPSTSRGRNNEYDNPKKTEEPLSQNTEPLLQPKDTLLQNTTSRKMSLKRKVGSKVRKYVKEAKMMSENSIGSSGTQRLQMADSLVKNKDFVEGFELLNKQAKTFLMMQLRQVRKKKMARRFTLEEKIAALTILKHGAKCYRFLQTMFALPSQRTLNRLSEQICFEPGVNPKIFHHLKASTQNWNTQKKLCNIVFDEIALTPHVTFNEKDDVIEGFLDVEERKMKFCDHALVFMIRGICSSWRQSIAYYFCEGTVSAVDLKKILHKIVKNVSETGLVPLGIVCDQGSTFRTAIRQMREETIRSRNNLGVRDDETVLIAGHSLSIFFDPPHLLKGLRNNFLTKNIYWGGKTATWDDILYIYDLDSKLGHTRAMPKLTAYHVLAHKIKKMKVSIAAQTLSARTAAMLRYTAEVQASMSSTSTCQSLSTMTTTAEVVEFMDNLFDSVNGYPGGAKGKKLRRAVKPNSDHLEFWKNSIKKLSQLKFIAKTKGGPQLVNVPSIRSWIVTLKSFIRVTKLLFDKYGVEYYYARCVNQDPLENFFGQIRAHNYRNTNPDASAFKLTFKSLVLTNILTAHSRYANCERDDGETILNINLLFTHSPQVSTSTSNDFEIDTNPSSLNDNLLSQVIFEKIRVHTSAYTAGYMCRKLTKSIKCKLCAQTYITEEPGVIHKYLKQREYKELKHSNLHYPNENFLMLYREASEKIHSFLNIYCATRNIASNIKKYLKNSLRFSWLGCGLHSTFIEKAFLKLVCRIQIHNWCNIINNILKGAIPEKYVTKMSAPQNLAWLKYKSYRLRKKKLNK